MEVMEVSTLKQQRDRCFQSTAIKIIDLMETAATEDYDGIGIAVIGVLRKHWLIMVQQQPNAEQLLKGEVFSIAVGHKLFFCIPVDDLPAPRILGSNNIQRL